MSNSNSVSSALGPKLLKLFSGLTPVGYAAFSTEVDDSGNTIADVHVSSKSPKDEWNTNIGQQVTKKHFLNPKKRVSFNLGKVTNFDAVRQALLVAIAKSHGRKIPDTARKAAQSMIRDQNGDDIKRAIHLYLTGNKTKVLRKIALIGNILASAAQKVQVVTAPVKESPAKKTPSSTKKAKANPAVVSAVAKKKSVKK